MTKAYLNLPKRPTSYAPRIGSRRFRNQGIAYKSDGGNDGGSDDPDGEGDREKFLDQIQKRIDAALATRATKEELKSIQDNQKESLKDLPIEALREMANEKTGVTPKLAEMALRMQRLETKLTAAESNKPKDMSVRGQIKSWLEGKIGKTETTVADQVRKIMDGTKVELPPLEIRAVASPMTFATVNSGSSAFIGTTEVEAGINDLVRAQPVFWDFLTKGRTNANTYVWINKSNSQGAAAFIGPGVTKPGISLSQVVETSVAKKIAVSSKATTELLQDIDGMATFIEQELKYQLNIEVNRKLMTGVSSSTVPAGIQTLSSAYTLTSIKTSSPTYMDALRAAVAQLRSGWLTGDITIFINSVDSANMDLAKANNSGVYLLPPFVTSDGRTISGARVIEDNNVPVGYFQAAMLRYYRVLIYKDFTVMWGWENDDFTKNLSTVIGEMRLHQFFNDQYTGAFIYDTFANVQTAITAV